MRISVPSPSISAPTFVVTSRLLPFFLSVLIRDRPSSPQELLIGAPLVLSLTLLAPPPTLAILGIQAYVIQTTILTPSLQASSSRTSSKKWILREGVTSGWSKSGFAERCRREGRVLMDGKKVKLKDGDVWKWVGVGRLVSPGPLAI